MVDAAGVLIASVLLIETFESRPHRIVVVPQALGAFLNHHSHELRS